MYNFFFFFVRCSQNKVNIGGVGIDSAFVILKKKIKKRKNLSFNVLNNLNQFLNIRYVYIVDISMHKKKIKCKYVVKKKMQKRATSTNTI